MNRYKIKLWPEKSKTDEIRLEQTAETVISIANEYSNEGRKAANRKWIEPESINIKASCIL